MTHCKLFKMQEYITPTSPRLTPCCISCILKTTTSPLSLCSGLLSVCFALSQHLPVSQHYLCWHDVPCHHQPSLSHFGPSAVTHLSRHLPAQVPLCHCFCRPSPSASALSPRVKCVTADGACRCFFSTNCHRSVTYHMSVDLCS